MWVLLNLQIRHVHMHILQNDIESNESLIYSIQSEEVRAHEYL